jgi:2-hydroxychromene-2-carboxylate isomerase
LTRLAAAAQDQDKGLEFLDKVMRMMWDGQNDNWPDFLIEYMDRAGMDGKSTDADVKANADKYDAILDKNGADQQATGHGGVPNMALRGEPFFAEDRFDLFFDRLNQNGLTKRKEAIAQLPTSSWTSP